VIPVPGQAPRLRGWSLVRGILFWVMMTALAFAWLAMHDMGRGTRVDRVVAFAPLAGVVVLFLLILAVDRKLKRTRSEATPRT
jgi:hypothetical protein